jgi:hypothetical protein
VGVVGQIPITPWSGLLAQIQAVLEAIVIQLKDMEQRCLPMEVTLRRQAWRQVVRSSLQQHGGLLHTLSKRSYTTMHSLHTLASGEVTSSALVALHDTAEQWKAIWKAEVTEEVRVFAPSPQLPLLLPADIRGTAACSKLRTACPDGFHPKAWHDVCPGGLNRMVQVLTLSEQAGRLPAACTAIVRLLPKPQGGFRTISLFTSLMRVWGKARVRLLRDWMIAECSHVFSMRPGRRCLDGVCWELLRAARRG